MRKLRLLLAIASLSSLVLAPSRAKADSVCGDINLGSFVPTITCTIGDKTFAFTTFSLAQNAEVNPIPLSAFEIVPDASNPLAPSFTIEAAPGTTIMVPLDTGGEVTLNFAFDVSTTNGSTTISGLDATASGNVSGESTGLGTHVEAINSLTSGTGVLFNTTNLPETIACIQNGGNFLLPGCIATNGAGSQPNSLTFGTPVSSLHGVAIVDLVTGDGTATLTSATFSIDEIPQTTPTPEPGSLVLLSTGLLGVLGAFRRRRCLRNHWR